jgi:hypothetical protein
LREREECKKEEKQKAEKEEKQKAEKAAKLNENNVESSENALDVSSAEATSSFSLLLAAACRFA